MQPIDADYTENLLLPPSIEDWIPRDHPARFIREVVGSLDLEALGFPAQKPAEGRRPYAHALLLRVWLYGYWKRTTSMRKLETACKEDLGFIWLCGGHQPDHNTIWRFFQDHHERFADLFKSTVKVAMKLDLVGGNLQALDGTKIQAKCSSPTGYTVKHLKEVDAELDAQIAELEAQLQETGDQAEHDELRALPETLNERKALREEVKEALEHAEESGVEHVHRHDLEARRMKCEGRNRFSYNGQALVDDKHQFIIAADLTNNASDQSELVKMLKQGRAIRGYDVMTVVDGGYASASEFCRVDYLGFPILSNLAEHQKSPADKPYHSSRFKPSSDAQTVRCPQGNDLPFSRARMKSKRWIWVYRSAQVCKNCKVFSACTGERQGRSIDIVPGMWALRNMEEHIKSPDAIMKLAYRKGIVEPVFARIKEHGGFRRWTVGGLKKVSAQWQLVCTVYNLKVMYRKWREQGGSLASAALLTHITGSVHLIGPSNWPGELSRINFGPQKYLSPV